MRTKTTTQTSDKLPAGVKASDLVRPKWHAGIDKELKGIEWEDREFELWFTTGFGWCIPTLLISNPGRRSSGQTTARTYATTLDGKPCRIGKGPHVTKTVTVYVRTSRLGDLQKYLDIRKAGAADAGQIRDRISSRRAQGQLERAAGNRSWRWDV